MILIVNLLVILFGAILQLNFSVAFKKTVRQSTYKKVVSLLVIDFILVILLLMLFSFNAPLLVLKIVKYLAFVVGGLFHLIYFSFLTKQTKKKSSLMFYIFAITILFIFIFFGRTLGRLFLQVGMFALIGIGISVNRIERVKTSKTLSNSILMLYILESIRFLTSGVVLYELVWSTLNDAWLISLSFILKTFVVYFVVDINNYLSINSDIRDLFDRQSPEKMMDLILNENPNVIVLTDLEYKIIYANPRLYEVTGHKKEDVIGKNPKIFSSGKTKRETYEQMYQALKKDHKWEGEFINQKKSGEDFFEQTKIVKLFDVNNKPIFYLGIKTDITKEKEYLERVTYLSTYDGLTKLYRREYFVNYVNDNIEKNLDCEQYMLLLDIDEFKKINDVYSHLIGDETLKYFAKILNDIFGDKGIVSRFGGDEFTVYLYKTNSNEVSLLIEELHQTLKNKVINNSDAKFVITSSLGAYKLGQEKTFEEVYEQSDKLLYKAKRQGKSVAVKNF